MLQQQFYYTAPGTTGPHVITLHVALQVEANREQEQ